MLCCCNIRIKFQITSNNTNRFALRIKKHTPTARVRLIVGARTGTGWPNDPWLLRSDKPARGNKFRGSARFVPPPQTSPEEDVRRWRDKLPPSSDKMPPTESQACMYWTALYPYWRCSVHFWTRSWKMVECITKRLSDNLIPRISSGTTQMKLRFT